MNVQETPLAIKHISFFGLWLKKGFKKLSSFFHSRKSYSFLCFSFLFILYFILSSSPAFIFLPLFNWEYSLGWLFLTFSPLLFSNSFQLHSWHSLLLTHFVYFNWKVIVTSRDDFLSFLHTQKTLITLRLNRIQK